MKNISEVNLRNGRELNPNELMEYFNAHSYKFWSWGASKFKNDDRCFSFTTNGHHHKGQVYIVLNWADLFDVYLTNPKGEIKTILNDVYIEDLFTVLDNKIEKIDAYAS